MGLFWNRREQRVLDGLAFSSSIESPAGVRKSQEKLTQLLNASVYNHQPGKLAVPLTAAFFLGADPAELTRLFEKWSPQQQVWPHDDPTAESIAFDNLEDFYGQKPLVQRFYDYFRDRTSDEDIADWEDMVTRHTDKLWKRLANDDFSPLLELGAAVESENGFMAASALTLACVCDPGREPVNIDEKCSTDLGLVFRELARLALAKENLTGVLAVQACAEVFLTQKYRFLGFDQKLVLLKHVEKYLNTAKPSEIPILDPKSALDSENRDYIAYNRALLVLQKLAV